MFLADSENSHKHRLEWQINYLREELRRRDQGVFVPTSEPVESPAEEEEDENDRYLRLLDTDSAQVITDLQTRIQERDEKLTQLEQELAMKTEESLQNPIEMEDAVSTLLDTVSQFQPVGISLVVHEAKVLELNRQIELKESEVLWVKAEQEDKIAELNSLLKEAQNKAAAEKKDSLGQEDSKRMAFMQCGVLDDDSNSQTGLQAKVDELTRSLEEKEDHFSRELEVMKLKNTKLIEQLDLAKEINNLDDSTEDDSKFIELQEELIKVKEDKEKLLAEKKLYDTKENSLNESIHELTDRLSVANQSLEIEKVDVETMMKEKQELEEQNMEMQGKISALQEKVESSSVDSIKTIKLENETLKSELERTKLKYKEAQESSLKVHEEAFVEHKYILDTMKTFSARKRKRFIEDVYTETKKLREEDDCVLMAVKEDQSTNENVEPSHDDSKLLNETIDNDTSLVDSKDDVSSVIETIVESVSVSLDVSLNPNELNLEKMEALADAASKQTKNLVMTGVDSIDLDEAEFIIDEAVIQEQTTRPVTSAQPAVILQAKWEDE